MRFTVSTKAEDTIFSLAQGQPVVYLNTFSKTLSPALRVGYMLLPNALLPRFAEKCGFAMMHIFPYSRRAGTPADAMPDQIPKAVKAERAARAGEVAKALRERYDSALIGTVQEVLFEQTEGDFFTGHAKNFVKVYARGENLHNELCPVRITALREDGVEGELCR